MRSVILRLLLSAVCLGLSLPGGAAESASAPMTIFAAASLTEVLQKIGADYTRSSHVHVRFSFAASSALAKQIEQGAGAGVFFSADQEWMDYLAARQLIDASSRRDVVGNRLALVAPASSTIALQVQPKFALLAALGANGRIATGDPDSVPVGKYAKAALTSLDVWNDVEPRLVRAENVRSALAFVARGETPLGIVYATDAKVEPKVRVVDLFPEATHPRIAYPVAAVKPASAQAKSFIAFLSSPAARKAFVDAGFEPL